jgi:hypothetical protein
MAEILDNFRATYKVLAHRVRIALRTQVGDARRLELQRDEVLRMWSAAEQVGKAAPCVYYIILILLGCWT